ncbi:MAG: sulfite exporter TauE/SafE family protein [Phycisphaeraceae bacterium]|nr:sulfite exporter TauE/SafE family protein [Phycisphaeraceae bacterium]
MTALPFILLLVAASLGAGFLGALTGLGGGVVIVPILVLLFGVDLRFAVGASLVAVIATSSGAAAAYVREGYTNIRVGILLEVATVTGAIVGAIVAAMVSKNAIASIFVVALFWSAYSTLRPPKPLPPDTEPDAISRKFRLDSSYPTKEGMVAYRVHHVPAGGVIMFFAGLLSALVGIGSGIVKVFAMDRMMRLPFKVSTTTSNFMIGVTAAASAGVYLQRGQIQPAIAAPVALGALIGSLAGARVLPHIQTKALRYVFAGVVVFAGIELLRRVLSNSL